MGRARQGRRGVQHQAAIKGAKFRYQDARGPTIKGDMVNRHQDDLIEIASRSTESRKSGPVAKLNGLRASISVSSFALVSRSAAGQSRRSTVSSVSRLRVANRHDPTIVLHGERRIAATRGDVRFARTPGGEHRNPAGRRCALPPARCRWYCPGQVGRETRVFPDQNSSAAARRGGAGRNGAAERLATAAGVRILIDGSGEYRPRSATRRTGGAAVRCRIQAHPRHDLRR